MATIIFLAFILACILGVRYVWQNHREKSIVKIPLTIIGLYFIYKFLVWLAGIVASMFGGGTVTVIVIIVMAIVAYGIWDDM